MALAEVLSSVMTRVILFVVLAFVVTPIGLAMRLLGADPLRRRAPLTASGWHPCPPRHLDPRHYAIVKLDRLLETYLGYAPRGFGSFVKAMPLWNEGEALAPGPGPAGGGGGLRGGVGPRREGRGEGYRWKALFGDHHESHAASAFYPSPFEEAAILTLDGVGEWATSSVGFGRGSEITLLREMRFPDSLGLLYSAFTCYAGFKVNSGEYKVMGLASYGEPRYVDLILSTLVHLAEDGSVRLNQEYFGYADGLRMTSSAFDRLFGGPPREPETRLTQKDLDLARSIQDVTEEAMLRMARFARRETGLSKLCLAGGVALNRVGNGRILRDGGFTDLWIQPAAGDAGGSPGSSWRGTSPTSSPRRRSSASTRGGWSSGLGPWGRGASSGTPAPPGCSRS